MTMRKEYEFSKLKEPKGLSSPETEIFNGIFEDKDVVNLTDLKYKFYKHITKIKQNVYTEMKEKEYFVENPYEEIYLREYARKLKMSVNSAQRFLDSFLKEGFVVDFRRGNLRYFKANLNSVSFRHVKITFSLKQIESSGLISYL